MRSSNFFRGLWRDADFLKFWTGETFSLFGAQITGFAIPLVAAVTLQASPAQMGFLNASQFLPYLLITLFAGVWIDQRRRKSILIITNLARALLLSLIPISFLFNFLQMEYLYLIIFLTGFFTVFFDLAYQSYLPSLVNRSNVVEGNSRLQMSASTAQVSGPGISGFLVSIFTAPIVIIIGTFTYFISAISMILIKKKEPKPIIQNEKTSVFKAIKEGMRIIFTNPHLRAICGEAAFYNFFSQVTWAVMILYITRELQIGSGVLGIVLATSSIGALAGSLIANYAGSKFNTGRTILGSMIIACSAPLLVPLANGPSYLSIPILIISFFISGIGVVISNVHVISLRQTVTPENLLGRMNASYRFIITGVAPIGALLGGYLGTVIGLRFTLFVGAIGTMSALLWVIFSPLPRLKKLPDNEDQQAL